MWQNYNPSFAGDYRDDRLQMFQWISCKPADVPQRGERPMQTIPAGAKGSFSLVVTPEHLANRFKDAMLPPILATPVMIMVMENAALNAVKPYLGASESALGTRVDVRHVAATPAGRRIEFTIRATDGSEVIGIGTHERVIIDLVK